MTVSGEAPLVDVDVDDDGNQLLGEGHRQAAGRPQLRGRSCSRSRASRRTSARRRAVARAPISIYGSTSAENLFLIDGVNTTNVIKGFQGKDINTEFIQEVEVKTGGYQAEYGRNTGGVVNVITKSGGNEFHGGVFGYYNDTGHARRARNGVDTTRGLLADRRRRSPDNDHQRRRTSEESASTSAASWKDQVWFFGAYDRVQTDQNLQPLDRRRHGSRTSPATLTSRTSTRGKLTFNLAQGTTIVGGVFSDRADAARRTPVIPEHATRSRTTAAATSGGPDYGARAEPALRLRSASSTLQYGQHKDRFVTTPTGTRRRQHRSTSRSIRTRRGPRRTRRIRPGVRPDDQQPVQARPASAARFTAYLGNHEIKVGGDYQKDDTFGSTYCTGGQRLRDPSLPPGLRNEHLRSVAGARPTRTPHGATYQVFYQHDFFTANGDGPDAARHRARSTRRPSATAASSRTSGGSSRR